MYRPVTHLETENLDRFRSFSPQLLNMIKDDILKVISNYAEIEEDGLEIKMSKTRSENGDRPVSALVANIPLKNLKDRKI